MKLFMVLLLYVLSGFLIAPYQIAENPLEIHDVIPSSSGKSWKFEVVSIPTATNVSLQLNSSSCELYFLNQSGYQDWLNNAYTSSYIQLASFQNNFTFWEKLESTGTYYIAVTNHGDEPVSIDGTWVIDVWGPDISCNIKANQVVSGIITISVKVDDTWSDVEGISLYINQIEVKKTSNNSLNFEWNTYLHDDGQMPIQIIAVDTASNTNTLDMVVNIDNQITTQEESDVPSQDFTFPMILIFLFAVCGLISIVNWWRDPNRDTG